LLMRILEPIFLTQNIPANHVITFEQNPMLFAAWVGMLVTAINLLPVGQLDGGHIVYALAPRLHGLISRGIFVVLVGFGFLWPGWWLWAALIFFLIRFKHPPTLEDHIPLRRGSKWLGWVAIAIFLLTFSPSPI
jgi:membrane-associated protease RseP (regulator of RpoE activity)